MNPVPMALAECPAPAVVVPSRRFTLSYQTVGVLVASVEFLMIIAGSAFGPALYASLAGLAPPSADSNIGTGLLSGVLYLSIAHSAGLYRLQALLNPALQIRRAATACGVVLLALTAVLFLLKIGSDFSRGALLGFAAVMLLLCGLTRFGAVGIIESLMLRNGVFGRPAFLIGETDELASLSPSLLLRQFGLQEVGRVALDRRPPAAGPFADDLHAAIQLAHLSHAKEFIVATGFDDIARLTAIEETLRASPLPARLLPNHVFRSVLHRHNIGQDPNAHLIHLQRAPLNLAERAAKRGIDVVGALLALVILLPAIVMAAIAIKLDSRGPVIFRQKRNGYNRRPFTIFKFRTMTVLEDGDVVTQVRRGDNRVTPVGRMLRKTSIDELPQLWNVLKGDMSLVGPRPHALAHDDQYSAIIGGYSRRQHVKPGITGWAQINGLRGETSKPEQMTQRVTFDLWYIGNWSFILDLQIIFRTATEVLSNDAY